MQTCSDEDIMYAIISELDAVASVVVKDLWGRLRDACGLKAIYDLPTPHLTWFASEQLAMAAATEIIADLANRTPGLNTCVFGLGIFSGDRPVFYLPIVKSQAMIDLHDEIWARVGSVSQNANDYYAPAHWLPHITLAINDVTRDNLACALESVAFEPVELSVVAENLIIVTQEDDPDSMVMKQFQFKGKGS
jgi:2'-5' RNA ligase